MGVHCSASSKEEVDGEGACWLTGICGASVLFIYLLLWFNSITCLYLGLGQGFVTSWCILSPLSLYLSFPFMEED